MNWSENDLQALIDRAYRLILGRPADTGGAHSYLQRLQQGLPPQALLDELEHSEEKRQQHDIYQAPWLQDQLTPAVLALSDQLQACDQLSYQHYHQLWQQIFASGNELIIGQQDYGSQHKQRFWELVNAMLLLLKDKPQPRLLECGVSEFSALYKTLLPQLELHTLDRPVAADYIGFTPEKCYQRTSCSRHFAVDLQQPSQLPGHDTTGGYDLILLAEVLEHLVVNPVELLAQLLQLLKPGGYLYLTTPNFLAREKWQQLQQHENPQPFYPGGAANWDAHYHFREYTLKELFAIAQQAGGRISGFYFSSCWDDLSDPAQQQHLQQRPWERSNLVVVIAPISAPEGPAC